MSEKDELVTSWEREFQTTRRVLRAYPAERGDLRPHERSYSAKELGTTFVASHVSMTSRVLGTAREFSPAAVPAPGDWAALLAAVDRSHEEFMRTLREIADEHLRSPIGVPLRPGEMSDVPRSQVLWLALMDQIHHRGQLSVYVRLAGGKVPSIYGPSADEPWPEPASRPAPSARATARA